MEADAGARGKRARSGPSRENASAGSCLVEAADRGGDLGLGVPGRRRAAAAKTRSAERGMPEPLQRDAVEQRPVRSACAAPRARRAAPRPELVETRGAAARSARRAAGRGAYCGWRRSLGRDRVGESGSTSAAARQRPRPRDARPRRARAQVELHERAAGWRPASRRAGRPSRRASGERGPTCASSELYRANIAPRLAPACRRCRARARRSATASRVVAHAESRARAAARRRAAAAARRPRGSLARRAIATTAPRRRPRGAASATTRATATRRRGSRDRADAAVASSGSRPRGPTSTRYTLESNGDVPRAPRQVKGEIDEISTPDAAARSRRQRRRSSSTCASATSGTKATSPARSTCRAATSSRGSRRSSRTSDAPIIVYCASGARSAFAREDARRARLRATSSSWPAGTRTGSATASRSTMPASLDAGAARPLPPPPPHPGGRRGGQLKLLESRVLLIGAGGLGSPARSTWRPPASARSGSSTPTSSTSRTCSGRSCTRPTARRAEGRLREAHDRGAQPGRERRHLPGATDLREHRARSSPTAGT